MERNHEFTVSVKEVQYGIKLLADAEIAQSNGTTTAKLGWLDAKGEGDSEEEALQGILSELNGALSEGPGSDNFVKFEKYVVAKGRVLGAEEIATKQDETIRKYEIRWEISADEQYMLKPFADATIARDGDKITVSDEALGELGSGTSAQEVIRAATNTLNEWEGPEGSPGPRREEVYAWSRKIGTPVDPEILASEKAAKDLYENVKDQIAGITPDDIDALSRTGVPLLVDFWAPWCGPCRAITPALVELQAEWGSKMQFRKINVDDFEGIWDKFGFKGIPTMIIFRDGEEIHRATGWGGKENLVTELKPLVS